MDTSRIHVGTGHGPKIRILVVQGPCIGRDGVGDVGSGPAWAGPRTPRRGKISSTASGLIPMLLPLKPIVSRERRWDYTLRSFAASSKSHRRAAWPCAGGPGPARPRPCSRPLSAAPIGGQGKPGRPALAGRGPCRQGTEW